MKKVYILASVVIVLNLVSCQEIVKDSLHYTPDDGLELSKVFKLDSIESKGTYRYNGKAVSSTYMVRSKYYLLAIKLDSVSPEVKIKSSGNTPYKDVPGIYTRIMGDQMETHYNGYAIRKNLPINLITCISDEGIVAGMSNDSTTEFHTRFKNLVIYFNDTEEAQLYLEPREGAKNGDLIFYRKHGHFYLLFMSARDTNKPGTLRKVLFPNEGI